MNRPANSVLLIEDESKIRRFLRAGFELQGYSVAEAENATDGLKSATFSAPDIIILDLNLPDLHGSEVLERIRSWSSTFLSLVLPATGCSSPPRWYAFQIRQRYLISPGIARNLASGITVIR
jgi:two-component system, OmpR family, KDP operon response regulator KdpE